MTASTSGIESPMTRVLCFVGRTMLSVALKIKTKKLGIRSENYARLDYMFNASPKTLYQIMIEAIYKEATLVSCRDLTYHEPRRLKFHLFCNFLSFSLLFYFEPNEFICGFMLKFN